MDLQATFTLTKNRFVRYENKKLLVAITGLSPLSSILHSVN